METFDNTEVELLKTKLLELNIFDESWYLNKYRDVANSSINPLTHFILYGIQENRYPNQIVFSEIGNTEISNDYIRTYLTETIRKNVPLPRYIFPAIGEQKEIYEKAVELGLFDEEYYLRTYHDCMPSLGVHPFIHYINEGYSYGYNPGPNFNSNRYLEEYKQKFSIKGAPLIHFIQYGFSNGLEYWPARGYEFKNEKKFTIVEHAEHKFTMHYRSQLLEKLARDEGYSVRKLNIDRGSFDFTVHDQYAIYMVRTIPRTAHVESLIKRAKNFNVPIIYDLDDMIHDYETFRYIRSIQYRSREELDKFKKNSRNINYFIDMADALTTSTNAMRKSLLKYDKPVIVIPNSIELSKNLLDEGDLRNIRIGTNSETGEFGKVVVGYFSGTGSHMLDFQECKESLLLLLKRYPNLVLKIVGKNPLDPETCKNFGHQIIALDMLSYDGMLKEISKCDVILAPLETRNPFCDGKSELKIFEAALYRIPCVASPTQSYADIIQDGLNGFLAANKLEWETKLDRLIINPGLRREMGNRAFETILPQFNCYNAFTIFKNFVLNIRTLRQQPSYNPLLYSVPSPGTDSKAMHLTLIVTVFNKERELPYLLRSITASIFHGNLEVLFCDDCSTDHSADIIKNWIKYLKYSDNNNWLHAKYLKTGANSGNCAVRNLGLKNATSDIVIITDGDTMFSPNLFQEHYNYHTINSKGFDVCIGNKGIPTKDREPNIIYSRYIYDKLNGLKNGSLQDNNLHSSFVNFVTHNVSFNRKKFPLEFDEDFSYSLKKDSGFGWEDIEFGTRLFENGATFVFLNNCYTIHITHPSQYKGDDKPLKSLKNFQKLINGHPVILEHEYSWAATTFKEIEGWIKSKNYIPEEIADYATLKDKFSEAPFVLSKKKKKRLKILSHVWHVPHQYELCKTNHDFYYLILSKSKRWQSRERPRPYNIRYVTPDSINIRDYDLVISHFDEHILHQELTNGAKNESWGQEFKFLNQFRNEIPIISVCHGTPQFAGQFRPIMDGQNVEIIESSRMDMLDYLGDTKVVLNSYQALEEWGFPNSLVIWQGFQPSQFRPMPKTGIWSCMGLSKLQKRPYYNGFNLFKKCMKAVNYQLDITELINNPDFPFSEYNDVDLYGNYILQNYISLVASNYFYLNFTLRSPMPRMRGEAMMCGVIPITTPNHDASMFIRHGENGFLFNSAEEFADVIDYIVKHRGKWDEWSKNARNTAVSEFHIDRYLNDWSGLISEALGEPL